MIKTYYLLTKPGIILGNLITVAGGFALASQGSFDYKLFLAALMGLGLVIASSCIFNNYIDRAIDKKMERTKNRPFATGLVSVQNAILFAIFLGMIGILILLFFTNFLTTCLAVIGFLTYVILYSVSKIHTSYATLIGSISGAIPPVVGYCAVSNRFDMGAILLFLIMILWQMPHFFSIAIYRFDDYAAALIPVLPVRKGVHATKIQMSLYIIAFMMATAMLVVMGYTGYFYLGMTMFLSCLWLWLCIRGFKSSNDKLWSRQMFFLSLAIITLLCAIIPFDVKAHI